MKQSMQRLAEAERRHLSVQGFARTASRVWRVVDQVYQLIDFQPGAHGEYFFVNACVHPVGLPALVIGDLVVREQPQEYQCVVRARIEQISNAPIARRFQSGFVPPNDLGVIEEIGECLTNDVVPWLEHWGSLNALAYATDAEIGSLLTVVPILQDKCCAMLRCYCLAKLGDVLNAREQLGAYFAANSGSFQFPNIDDFLQSVVG